MPGQEKLPPWPWVFSFTVEKVAAHRVTCGAWLGLPGWVLDGDAEALATGRAHRCACCGPVVPAADLPTDPDEADTQRVRTGTVPRVCPAPPLGRSLSMTMNLDRVFATMALTAAATLISVAPASADSDFLADLPLVKALSDIQGNNAGNSGTVNSHGDNNGNSNQANEVNDPGADVLDFTKALGSTDTLV